MIKWECDNRVQKVPVVKEKPVNVEVDRSESKERNDGL